MSATLGGRQGGAALLLTVWVLLLLSILCGSALLVSRGEALRARQLEYQAQGRAAADGAVRVAVDALTRTTGEPLRQLERNGLALTLEPFEIHVSIRRESGKVDLNAARADLIAALLNQFLMPGAPAIGQDAIEHWRSSFRAREPSVRPFVRAQALTSLPGTNHAVIDCALPYVTVHSGATEPDPLHADPYVIAAMKTYRQVQENQGFPDSSSAGHVYAITARALRRGPDVVVQRHAIARPTGNPNAPVQILEWLTTYPPKSSLCNAK